MAKYGIKSHILMETRKMACMEILLPKRKRSKKFAFLQQKKHVDDTWCYYRVQELPMLKEAMTASEAWTKNLCCDFFLYPFGQSFLLFFFVKTV